MVFLPFYQKQSFSASIPLFISHKWLKMNNFFHEAKFLLALICLNCLEKLTLTIKLFSMIKFNAASFIARFYGRDRTIMMLYIF